MHAPRNLPPATSTSLYDHITLKGCDHLIHATPQDATSPSPLLSSRCPMCRFTLSTGHSSHTGAMHGGMHGSATPPPTHDPHSRRSSRKTMHDAPPAAATSSNVPEPFSSSYCPAFCEMPAPPSPPPHPCLGGPHQLFWHPPNPLAPPIDGDGDGAAVSHSSDSCDSADVAIGAIAHAGASVVASQTRLKPLSSQAQLMQSWPGDSCTHDSSFEAASFSTPSAPHTPAHSSERSLECRAPSVATAAAAAAAAGVPVWHHRHAEAAAAQHTQHTQHTQHAPQTRHAFSLPVPQATEPQAAHGMPTMAAAAAVEDGGSSGGNTAASPKPPASPPAPGLPRNVWSPPDRSTNLDAPQGPARSRGLPCSGTQMYSSRCVARRKCACYKTCGGCLQALAR